MDLGGGRDLGQRVIQPERRVGGKEFLEHFEKSEREGRVEKT